MDLRLSLMTGVDIPVKECQLILHQPTIKEIAYIGEEDFFKGVQTLCLNKSMFVTEDKSALDDVNNFQIFMTIINEKEIADKKEAVKKVLSISFPDYKIIFSPRSIIFSRAENSIPVDESNFEILQNYLREVFCSKTGPMDQQAFNPANKKAKEIADKLMRGRQRVAEQNNSVHTSIFSQYLSSLTIGLNSMGLNELMNCTMYQLYDLIERYSLYMSWDIDIRSRLAGAKSDSKPDNWMKNIH